MFLLMLAFYLGTTAGHLFSRDGTAMFFMTSSLARDGHFDVPQNINTGGGRLGRDGRYYSPYGIGQALVAAPLFMIGQWLTERTDFHYLAAFMTSLTNSFVTAALISILFVFYLMLGYSRHSALLTALVTGLTTMLWPYSRYFFSEPLVSLGQLGAVFLIYRAVKYPEQALVSLGLAGFSFGLAIVTRPITVLFCPVLLFYFVLEARYHKRAIVGRHLVALFGVIGLFSLIVAYYNWHRYGNPFIQGYMPLPDGSPQTFNYPFLKGLAVLLVSPGKSLFLFSPVLLLALTGLPRLYRRFPALTILIMVLSSSYIALYARWCQIEGGYSWGPRFLLPIIPLLALPLIEPMQRWATRSLPRTILIICLLVASFLVQMLAVLVNYTEIIELTQTDYYDPIEHQYNYFYNPIPDHISVLADYITGQHKPLPFFDRPVRERKGLYIINLDWSGTPDLWFFHLWSDGLDRTIILSSLGLLAVLGTAASLFLLKWLREIQYKRKAPA